MLWCKWAVCRKAGLSLLLSLTQPVFGLEDSHVAFKLETETTCGMNCWGKMSIVADFSLLWKVASQPGSEGLGIARLCDRAYQQLPVRTGSNFPG